MKLSTHKIKGIFLVLAALIATGVAASLFIYQKGTNKNQNYAIGASSAASDPSGSWIVYDKFNGMDTKKDPAKVGDGENPYGQNTVVNDSDRISIRPEGYTIFPSTATQSTSTYGVTSVHTFHKIDGTNVLMRFWQHEMDYFNPLSNQWEILSSNFTTGTSFGFADVNLNLNYTSFVYFGNSVDTSTRWTGGYSILTSAVHVGDSTVTVSSTAGWSASSTASVVVCGTALPYNAASTTATQFFLTGTSTIACANGDGASQAIEQMSSAPRGNLYTVFNGRLFIGGISATTVFGGITSSPQWVMFSAYGDATTFAQSLNSATYSVNAGIFDLSEGGGQVVGFSQDQNNLYIFKRSIIYDVTVNSNGTFSINPLKPFDGKSQTVGSVTGDSTFTGANGTFFLSADNQIMFLTVIQNINYPQIIPISDPIKSTVDAMDFSQASGIVYKNKAYIAVKNTSADPYNNVVLVYDIINKWWDSPIVGWDVSHWAIYNSGTGGDQLMWTDSAAPNVWQVTQNSTDYNYGFSANWASKQYDFGDPTGEKQIDSVFIDGYISPNTNLTITLLLDENGFTQKYTTVFKGTEQNYLFNAPALNVFGFNPFGYQRFGNNNNSSNEVKFRIYLNKSVVATPFYTAQIQFSSNDISQQWEILQYGFHVRPFSQHDKPSLYRTFQ